LLLSLLFSVPAVFYLVRARRPLRIAAPLSFSVAASVPGQYYPGFALRLPGDYRNYQAKIPYELSNYPQ
jgi:hypothetical protein